MFSDTQQEMYNIAKNFITKRLDILLSKSKTDDSKQALFFLLGISLLENNQSTTRIAKTLYQDNEYKIIRAFFIELNKLVNANAPKHKFIKAIIDPRFFAAKSNTPEYKQQLNQEFAKQLKDDMKIWLDTQKQKNIYIEAEFIKLYTLHIKLIEHEQETSTTFTNGS